MRHYESYACADTARANRLVAGGYVVHADRRIDNIFYYSTDGGKKWSHGLTVSVAVDPSCGIGRSGTAFAASIHDEPGPNGTSPSVLSISYSSHYSHSWQASSINADTRGIDRAYLTVDDTTGQFSGRIYVHGYYASKNPPASVLFYRSTNSGRDFVHVATENASTYAKPWFFPGNGVVNRKGTFFALFAELDDTKRNMSYRTDPASSPSTANAVLNLYSSRDGGQTIKLAGKIMGVYYDWRIAQLSMPVLAVDRSGGRFDGRLYAAWPDARDDRRTKIMMSYSIDDGRSWSSPRAVSDDFSEDVVNKQPNNFMPTVAVNRDGVVAIAWYDRRDNSDNIGYWVRFAASTDGGTSWFPSERVSTSANVASDDTRKNSGDTAGLVADSHGVFHPVWIDNRTGIPQMWTATVRMRPKASQP